MQSFLVYLFWPNPGGWHYGDARVQWILGACLLLILLSFLIRFWRSRLSNPMTRLLSKSWPSAAFWFGIVGVVFVVSREAQVQFISMRILWFLWVLILSVYLFFQMLFFRRRHYSVIKNQRVMDERERYLPRRKR